MAVKPLGFPSNPTDGQQYTFNGKKWMYNSDIPGWEALQVTDVKTIKKDTTSSQVLFGNDDTIGSSAFTLGDNITMNAVTKTISVADGAGSGLDADFLHSVSGSRFTENLKSGILYGGSLSVNTSNNAKFDVAAGSGIIVSTTGGGYGSTASPSTTITTITWSAQSSITVSNIGSYDTTWIYVDEDGIVQQQNGAFTDENYKQYIILGALVHPNRTTIAFVSNLPTVVYNTLNQYDEFIRKLGPAKISGHRISANGSNLLLDRSSGVSYIIGGNYVTDSSHPNVVSDAGTTAATIYRMYSDGAGGYTTVSNAAIDPNSYDNDSGTLQSVSSSEWTIQRVYYFPKKTNTLAIYYGKVKYNSLAEALSGVANEVWTESNNTKDKTIFCAYLIVKGNASQLNNSSDAKIIQGSIFREIVSSGSGGGGAVEYISDLLDVQTSAPVIGEALIWNGSNWVNQRAITYISELDDVQTSSPTNGQFLVWNGSNWTNQSLTGKISYVSSPTAPSTTLYNAGDRWYNTTTGIEYTLIDDGSDLFWVNIYLSPNEDYIMSELTTFMKYVSSSSTPSVASYKAGDKWFNTSTGVEYTLVDDGSDKQWVNLNTNFIAHVHPISDVTGLQTELDGKSEFFYSLSPPASPNVGDRWMDSSTGDEYVYIYDGDSYQWLQPSISAFSGPVLGDVVYVTSSTYTASINNYYIGVNRAGAVTITLPDSPQSGRMMVVKDESGYASYPSRIITIVPYSGADTIDGKPSVAINTDYGGLDFIYRNGWHII